MAVVRNKLKALTLQHARLRLQHRVHPPPVPPLITVASDYSSGCCLECCLQRLVDPLVGNRNGENTS